MVTCWRLWGLLTKARRWVRGYIVVSTALNVPCITECRRTINDGTTACKRRSAAAAAAVLLGGDGAGSVFCSPPPTRTKCIQATPSFPHPPLSRSGSQWTRILPHWGISRNFNDCRERPCPSLIDVLTARWTSRSFSSQRFGSKRHCCKDNSAWLRATSGVLGFYLLKCRCWGVGGRVPV